MAVTNLPQPLLDIVNSLQDKFELVSTREPRKGQVEAQLRLKNENDGILLAIRCYENNSLKYCIRSASDKQQTSTAINFVSVDNLLGDFYFYRSDFLNLNLRVEVLATGN